MERLRHCAGVAEWVTPIIHANANVAVDNLERESIEKLRGVCCTALLFLIFKGKSFSFYAVALQEIARYSTGSAYGGAGIYQLE